MPDPRITKLAKVMVHYSLALKPGQQCAIHTHPLAEELTLAVYEEAIKAGAFVTLLSNTPGAQEIFYKYASDAQLDYVSPLNKIVAETFDANLHIWSEHNTRSLAGIDPKTHGARSQGRCANSTRCPWNVLPKERCAGVSRFIPRMPWPRKRI